MKKVAQSFGLAVTILLMAAAVLTFLAPRFGWEVDTVFSGSMEPQLKTGSVAITRPVEAEDIKVGDIITFHSPLSEKLISHRVIAVEDSSSFSFRTKGDANEDADPFVVPAQSVVGKICFHIPYFGYAAQFIKTPLGLLLTLCLPGLAIIVMEVVSICRVINEAQFQRKYRIR
jgi:signal peptidase